MEFRDVGNDQCQIRISSRENDFIKKMRERNKNVIDNECISLNHDVIYKLNLKRKHFYLESYCLSLEEGKIQINLSFLLVTGNVLIFQEEQTLFIMKNEIDVDSWREAFDNTNLDVFLKNVLNKNNYRFKVTDNYLYSLLKDGKS